MNKNRIHIVHVIPSLSFGGAERFLVDLINHSDHTKFHYSIVLFFEDMPLEKELVSKISSVRIVQKKGKVSWYLFRELALIYKSLEADIVHTHLFGGDFWGRIAAKRIHLPIITTEHGFNEHEGRIKHFLRWYLRNYSDYYTVPSKILKENLISRYHVKKPISVIPHGVELSRFKDIKPLSKIQPLRFVIIGRLSKQKGHDVALRALAPLKKYAWQLDIVGEGEEKKQLERISLALDIGERVRFLSATEHIPSVLKEQHVLLVPSRGEEGFGIVAIEGMAAGRLVVASAAGGLKEVVKSGKNGFLVTPQNIEELSKRLEWCLKEPEELKNLAEQGKKYALDNFDINKVVTKYEEIYFNLAKK